MQKDDSSNLKFEYLVRDEGNYKYYAEVIVKGVPEDLENFKKQFNDTLIDKEFFYPNTYNLPPVDEARDTDFHEVDKFSITDEPPTVDLSWQQLLVFTEGL